MTTDEQSLQAELESTQRALVDASRRAGMADVATSVLHNVGNVLNSVNVSASVLHAIVKGSKAAGVGKSVALLRAQADPGRFLTEDPRGRKLLDYLDGIGAALEADCAKAAQEITELERNIEHIKAIVVTQQAHVRPSDASERLSIRATLQDVVRMAKGSMEGLQVATICDFDALGELDTLTIDRHKLFQILVNLLTNAAHALRPRSGDRRITVAVRPLDNDHIEIRVTDNGVGIPAENLTRIFAHGFTTRATGHGFGLHSCANAATEMGGWLVARSDGPGTGASFALVVPRSPPDPDEPISPSRRGAAFASP